ncbi:MAG: aspartate-semialdehyde dehydrogenase [Candidatus Margulisbacteria bacterium]|nr:aspartate-semialdehyde dehydrogenase [Candidatus Margulisiibacteriota bacterium]MBU1022165.1 aspartate-semialdehyde dehydrogenase [Candidatus Margulisiibacteriota bacterium]MBU1729396.1 aspartate-semialdehyde dehydrogenase [Candidatus Margulisiibacteriota bacterium]MBU1955669.1 aspartate-semialdehyde dehydrogenase [Candidatus Margulisiibacteriota bacterium]
MAKQYKVAVLGATGMVGKVMMQVLEERNFPISEFVPLASSRTAGSSVTFKGKKYEVIEANENSFKGIDIVLSSAGAKVSAKLAPAAVKAGAVVVDNTSHFRMDPEVPLVVPEVNGHAIKKHKGIIANPNCSTAQLVLALKPIHDAAKIKRVVVSTYQSTSGWGKEAVALLEAQVKAWSEGKPIPEDKSIFLKQIAFNVIPHIDKFLDNGYSKEEIKMVNETQKILEDDSIKVTATAVRVPVTIGHSEAVNIETEKKLTAAEVRKLLAAFPTVKVVDDPANGGYPTPIECAGKDDTFIGRIREDISVPCGIDLWIVSDNLRRGAALNAVLIAEKLISDGLI